MQLQRHRSILLDVLGWLWMVNKRSTIYTERWSRSICNFANIYKIWGSHSDGHEVLRLLRYNAMYSVGSQVTFRKNMSPQSSGSNKSNKIPAWKRGKPSDSTIPRNGLRRLKKNGDFINAEGIQSNAPEHKYLSRDVPWVPHRGPAGTTWGVTVLTVLEYIACNYATQIDLLVNHLNPWIVKSYLTMVNVLSVSS
jgi:hypothetical protein